MEDKGFDVDAPLRPRDLRQLFFVEVLAVDEEPEPVLQVELRVGQRRNEPQEVFRAQLRSQRLHPIPQRRLEQHEQQQHDGDDEAEEDDDVPGMHATALKTLTSVARSGVELSPVAWVSTGRALQLLNQSSLYRLRRLAVSCGEELVRRGRQADRAKREIFAARAASGKIAGAAIPADAPVPSPAALKSRANSLISMGWHLVAVRERAPPVTRLWSPRTGIPGERAIGSFRWRSP